MPNYVLTKTNLIASGYPKAEYPILHLVLFEWRVKIATFVGSVCLIWFCVTLQRGALRYQFARFGQQLLVSFVMGLLTASLFSLIWFGYIWIIFVPIVVATNDAFAYFVGRSFGRTPLIRLSPNKTLEGFLGGAVFTFVMIFFLLGSIFQYKSVIC